MIRFLMIILFVVACVLACISYAEFGGYEGFGIIAAFLVVIGFVKYKDSKD